MKIQVVILLLLVTCLSLSMAQGSYGNCCLRYVRKLRSHVRRNIQDYRMQETDGDCNIRAVLLLMKRRGGQSKPICANPEDKWVQNVMKAVDRVAGGDLEVGVRKALSEFINHASTHGLDYSCPD